LVSSPYDLVNNLLHLNLNLSVIIIVWVTNKAAYGLQVSGISCVSFRISLLQGINTWQNEVRLAYLAPDIGLTQWLTRHRKEGVFGE
jgi:hypothetical protein